MDEVCVEYERQRSVNEDENFERIHLTAELIMAPKEQLFQLYRQDREVRICIDREEKRQSSHERMEMLALFTKLTTPRYEHYCY